MVKLRSVAIFVGISVPVAVGLAACTEPSIVAETTSQRAEPVESSATETGANSLTPPELADVTVTNLVDEKSKNEVRTALIAAGVPVESVDRFFAQVDLYNGTVAKNSLLPSGFRQYSADYALGAMSVLWDKQFPEFIGTNCRINTFLLAEDLVTINPQQSEPDSGLLFLDEDAIANAPAPLFSEEELAGFKQVFSQIETTRERDSNQHVANIQKFFRSKGISFVNPKVKIVSVFVHDTLDEKAKLFIGHVGVAVPHEEGILFVEKLAFDKPYQALKFRDYEQLNTYLRLLYDDGTELDYSQPVIFSNDEVLSIS